CTTAGGEGRRDLKAVDEPAQPPDTDPAAVLHMRFGAEVSDLRAVMERVLAPGVVAAVVPERVLATLLVIHHEVDRDQRAARPYHPRWLRTIANKVPLGASRLRLIHVAILAHVCSAHGRGVCGTLHAESEL